MKMFNITFFNHTSSMCRKSKTEKYRYMGLKRNVDVVVAVVVVYPGKVSVTSQENCCIRPWWLLYLRCPNMNCRIKTYLLTELTITLRTASPIILYICEDR